MKYKEKATELTTQISQITTNLLHQLRGGQLQPQRAVELLETMLKLEAQLNDLIELEHETR